MGTTKSDVFSTQHNQIARIAKAIGHPARVAILDFLLKQKSCICKDIVDELPLSQPTISQHLRELKNAGLIKGEIEGNKVCYCLDIKGLEPVVNYCTKFIKQLGCSDASCC